MITYKFFADTTPADAFNAEFSSVSKHAIAYWRRNNEASLSDVEKYIKSLSRFPLMDATSIKMAVNQAKALRTKGKVIFGSRVLFEKLKAGKATVADKAVWVRTRKTGMLLRGSSNDKGGNRKARLDINNDSVVVVVNKNEQHRILVNFGKRKKDLVRLQTLCDANDAYFNLQVCADYICISFDESVLSDNKKKKQIAGRVLSIDMNPNYIGLAVCDDHIVIHKEVINMVALNRKTVKSTKKKHEKHQVTKRIIELAIHYQCEAIAVELLSIPNKDHGNGKTFNRLVNNTWHKNLFVNSLRKWCNIEKIKFVEIVAAYSSFIGCMDNPYDFDSVAAALEINRRAREALKGRRYTLLPEVFYPDQLANRWKESSMILMLSGRIANFKELFLWCQRTKFSYRNLFKRRSEKILRSFSLNSHKSLVTCHIVR